VREEDTETRGGQVSTRLELRRAPLERDVRVVVDVVRIGAGDGRVVLVVVAHADDVALFLGGTVALWADNGWRVVVVRATDDRWDSVGVDETMTATRNTIEFRAAAAVLGVHEIVELGYPTDTLADVSEVALRAQIIHAIRRFRPYALVTFDPYGVFHEDNQDHQRVGDATDEAFWCAQFDKHHPEHLAEGLQPHGVFERWYFARRLADVTDVVDIATTLERKLDAALAHDTMLRNLVHQLRLQAATGGFRVPLLDEAQDGDLGAALRPLLRDAAARTGARHGVGAAEEFRVVRFGGLTALLERFGERL
jgi:LmbE family N-acetylglucosaminyl deacetylase